jgi:tetratricopeptide (TPR) repeat protein
MIIIILLIFSDQISSQQKYLSKEDIKNEWNEYTSFQKSELINHSNLLFNEGKYEDALLNYFQFVYLYPNDQLINAAYFKIAKCYEMVNSWDLSINYYQKIISSSDSGSVNYLSSNYQRLYSLFKIGQFDDIVKSPNENNDPYILVFKAYAFFSMLDFDNAMLTFKSAEAAFDHRYYSDIIKPFYRAIETVENAPIKEKSLALVTSLFPGGGFLYLNQKESALGSIITSSLIFSVLANSNNISQKGNIPFSANLQEMIPLSSDLSSSKLLFDNSVGYNLPIDVKLEEKYTSVLIPPLVVVGLIYFGSMWKSVIKLDESNNSLLQRYAKRVIVKLPLENFMDYEIPHFTSK